MKSDEDLIKAFAKGENDALQSLYNLYSFKIYNTAISYVQSIADAEEIVQDVFIQMHKSASKFRFDASISTWVYRITVNKSLDYIRKKNSKKRHAFFVSLYKKDSHALKFDPVEFVHPGVVLERQEDSIKLYNAINNLGEKQKTVFILTQIEELSHKEVAEIMNSTSKAVESLLQRAKSNLRKCLEDSFPERGISKKKTSK